MRGRISFAITMLMVRVFVGVVVVGTWFGGLEPSRRTKKTCHN